MEPTPQLSPIDLIDLDRYPIHRLDTAKGRRLVGQCRGELERKALCSLPEFIRAGRLQSLVDEAAALIPVAHYRNEEDDFDSYQSPALRQTDRTHTRVLSRYRQILNDHIAPEAAIRHLYQWPALTEFVRQVFGAETMYHSHCPHLSLTFKVEGEGDTDGWHYDGNDGVVSLLLQKPDSGGEFEYAPYIRTKHNPNHDAVTKLLSDPQTYAQRPEMGPGTFVFFNGNLSLHRVAPVGKTSRPRIIALLSYDRRPDQIFSPKYVEHLRSFPVG